MNENEKIKKENEAYFEPNPMNLVPLTCEIIYYAYSSAKGKKKSIFYLLKFGRTFERVNDVRAKWDQHHWIGLWKSFIFFF